MPTNRDRTVVLLIHGFGSCARCWKEFLALFESDPDLEEMYEFRTFEYPTAMANLKPFQRLPRLSELGELLIEELETVDLRSRQLVLVGHSQGGLVIQKAIANMLLENRASELLRVRQIILVATPNSGSGILSPVRKFISRFLPNPQERALRAFNPQIKDLMTLVRGRIVNAEKLEKGCCSIPITAIAAAQDAIVTESSAHGDFTNTSVVPGDHFTVLKPDGHDDPRYDKIKGLLLEPYGHQYVFEIDRYETEITVAPLPAAERRLVRHGLRKRHVETESEGTILRRVSFGPRNTCFKKFVIRYGTRDGGYIEPTISGAANEAGGEAICRYDDYGLEYTYEFTPTPGSSRDYSLRVDVLKGFEAGNQDVHFHLGRHSFYKALHYKVDLGAYVKAGFELSEPRLYLHRRDSGHGELCARRNHDEPEKPISADPGVGVWEWEITNLREGVVDIVWCAEKSVSGSTASRATA